MPEKSKLKIWQWFLLFLIGFLFPIYNILLNNFILNFLKVQVIYYIISVMITTVIFSLILFLILNFFRRRTGFEKRIDAAFMLYILSVSFGCFFTERTGGIGIFVFPFLIAYFLEIKKILNEFPRE